MNAQQSPERTTELCWCWQVESMEQSIKMEDYKPREHDTEHTNPGNMVLNKDSLVVELESELILKITKRN